MLPFITVYHPSDSSFGSIDPLGAMQTYSHLADRLLPGMSTITNRSRYLSMICAALANSEKHWQFDIGTSGLAQRRKSVEPFERLWALACVAAREHGNDGAADGLRGISYAEKTYRHFMEKSKRISCDFQLLKYQSRTGAVGTYWTAMVGGQLVDANSGSLLDAGKDLADEFPELPLERSDLLKLADPDLARKVSLAFDALLAWGKSCHLQAATNSERKQLGEALTADDRREFICQALLMMKNAIPDSWEVKHLERLGKKLKSIPRADSIGMPVVIQAIVVTEQFHESILRIFETLLWWGTQHADKPIADLFGDSDFRKSCDHCRNTASSFRQFFERCELPSIRDGIKSFAAFATEVDSGRSDRDLVNRILERHRRVQSGKLDGGMPKRDWISWDKVSLLRPAPRFQRNDRPSLASGASLTHPYRLEPFVYMLRENGLLPNK